jgi:hypothetical protein
MATVLCRLPRGCILQSVHTPPPPDSAFDSASHVPPKPTARVLDIKHGVNDDVPLSLIELWQTKANMGGLQFTKLGEDSSGPVYELRRSPIGILQRAMASDRVIK